jgi:hypothetical protein
MFMVMSKGDFLAKGAFKILLLAVHLPGGI